MISSTLSRPLLAVPIILTGLTGLGVVFLGIAVLIAHTKALGFGVGTMLIGYGLLVTAIAILTARGHSWALGLIVASSLLHTLVTFSFATAGDRLQTIGSVVVAVPILTTLTTAVLAHGKHELEKVKLS